MRVISVFLPASLMLSLVFMPLAANAHEDDSTYEADCYVRYAAGRSLKGQAGKVQTTESEVDYSYNLKLGGKLPVKLTVNPEYVNINNSSSVDLPSHLTGFSTDVETTFPFFSLQKTYFRVGLTPSFYGSNWTFDSRHFRMPSRYYAIYRPDDKWTYVCGVAIYPRYENFALPILGFIYKANDKLTFNLIPDRPNISYALTDKLTLFTEGNGSLNEFVVSRDNAQSVVLRYTEAYLGAGARYKISKNIEASVSVGGVFDHTLRYRDSGGKASVKDGLFTEFRIQANI